MKILLDQMSDGWYDRLQHLGHDTYSVTKLREQGIDIQGDPAVGEYAKKNDLILVTKDSKFAKYCKAVDISHIHMDDDDLFKILLQKMNGHGPHVEN